MYVNGSLRKGIKNGSANFCAYLHRRNRVRFLCTARIYLEASGKIRVSVFHIRYNVFAHFVKSVVLVNHNRADSHNSKYFLKSFHSLVKIINLRAEYVHASLLFFYFKFSLYFGERNPHLLYKGVLKHISVFALNCDFCVFN